MTGLAPAVPPEGGPSCKSPVKGATETDSTVKPPVLKGALKAVILFLAAALACSSIASASAPEWLRAAAQTPLPKYADDTDAVLLLSEQITTDRV